MVGFIYWQHRRRREDRVAQASPIRLVVGLGNPGSEYRNSRHNAGFLVVEQVVRGYDATFRGNRAGETAEIIVDGRRVYVLKPQTFMNLSGTAVAPFARRHGIAPSSILVVSDDLDLPMATIRVRRKGSSGGHNGLKSCIAELGTEGFPRVKVGIGRPDPGASVVDWVLSAPEGLDGLLWASGLERAAEVVRRILEYGVEAALGSSGG